MLGQTARSTDLRVIPTQALRAEREPKVAVLLNANARKVTARVIKSLTHVVAEEDLYVSHTAADAKRIAEAVVDKQYQTVFLGGGDGTFMAFVNEIQHQLELRRQYHPQQKSPRFGVLKLGTGNGLAGWVNASPSRGDRILDDVLRARSGEVPGYRRLDLMQIDGQRAVFAGMGVDGRILNDYIWVKQNLAKGALKKVLAGGPGYFTSVATRTIPHYLTHSTFHECEVINGAAPAYRLAPDGSTVEEIGPGALLLRGRINFAAASTIPFYGYNFKMFPFAAKRRGTMQLRLAAVTAAGVVGNLRKLWTGRWFNDDIHDFHVSEAKIQFADPMPLQVGGDAQGYRATVHLGMASEGVELVDFTGTVN